MAKRADHLHKYKKKNLSLTKGKEYWVYACVKPTCSHYVPIHLAENKLCECNRCGDPMLITKAVLTGGDGRKPLSEPHCLDCTKRKNQGDVDAIAAFISEHK